MEKFIIWQTHDKRCYWCGEPMSLKTQSIDHIIPEDMEDKLEIIKTEYHLPGNFVINGFCNWVPAHNNCNSKKGFELFIPSPVFLAILNNVVKKSIPAYKSFVKLRNEMKAEETLEKLLVLVDEGKISEEEVLQKFGYEIFKDKKIDELGLEIPPGEWKVISVDDFSGIVEVSNGKFSGRTIIPPSDHYNPWWVCPVCRYYGPWSGSKCLSCGQQSDPNV